MKVADYIINYLGNLGVKDIFVVYGSANGDLIDAFTRTDKTRYVCVMHEQAGGFAAEAYAKVTKNIGVAMSTSGPGGHNFVTPIGNCFYDSVPCLFITGQINSKFLRPNPNLRQIGFQETDIVNIVKPITKYATMVTKVQDIPYELSKAICIAKSGRPGPVLLDLPLNIQKEEIDPNNLYQYNNCINKYSEENIINKTKSALDVLYTSHRPSIVVGGGVKFAQVENTVRNLIKKLKIPAFPTWNAVDVIGTDFEYYGGKIGTYGGAGRNFGIQNSDFILFLGSRLSGRITGGNVKSFGRQAFKVMVDIDEHMLQPHTQQVACDINIHANLHKFLEIFDNLYNAHNVSLLQNWTQWTNQVIEWKNKYDCVTPEMFAPQEYIHPYAFLRILSEEMTKDDIILGDCGGNIVAMNHAFNYKTGQIHITNNGNSPMGFSFAAGIGACLAYNKKGNVVAVIGDGGFNMNIQELQTLKNYNIPLKCIILNNHIYGITKAFQEVNFEGRCEACGPVGYNPPNFIKIAQAYDIPTMSISSGQDYFVVRDSIREFLTKPGYGILDVNCHEYHYYRPAIVGWDCPIEDMTPLLTREEFGKNMYIEWTDFSKKVSN